MGDRDDGAGVLRQVLLQPLHALGVEVVGRLVEQQQVGRLEQQLAQRDPAALTTGEQGDVGVRRRAAQRVHRQLELGVDVPRVGVVELLLELAHLVHQLVGVVGRHLLGDLVEPLQLRLRLGDRLLDVAEHGLRVVERRLLREHADGVAGHQPGLAVARPVLAGHDPQQARLTGAVRADHADLGAGQEAQRDVVEDDLVAVRLARLLQRVDELSHGARTSLTSRQQGFDPMIPGAARITQSTPRQIHSARRRNIAPMGRKVRPNAEIGSDSRSSRT